MKPSHCLFVTFTLFLSAVSLSEQFENDFPQMFMVCSPVYSILETSVNSLAFQVPTNPLQKLKKDFLTPLSPSSGSNQKNNVATEATSVENSDLSSRNIDAKYTTTATESTPKTRQTVVESSTATNTLSPPIETSTAQSTTSSTTTTAVPTTSTSTTTTTTSTPTTIYTTIAISTSTPPPSSSTATAIRTRGQKPSSNKRFYSHYNKQRESVFAQQSPNTAASISTDQPSTETHNSMKQLIIIMETHRCDGHHDDRVRTIGNVPVSASASIPLCSMKIFVEDTDTEIFVAENVKIGDKLKLEIKIEEQPVYGMKVTNCLVRDGLNWAEHPLLNDEGCPVDDEILGQFKYNKNLTKATVSFQAHKFPYTSSVYYQCNVRLCLKQAGGCGETPPKCDQNRHNFRKRRDLNKPSIAAALRTDEIKELSVEVYSGLYVNEADSEEEADLLPPKKIVSEQEFCISMRKFVFGVTIASLLLLTAVVLLVACILQRRRRRKNISTTCSSIYSGPYSNRGFS